MNNNFQSIIGNLEKGDKLVLGNNEKFSNEIVLNHSLQCWKACWMTMASKARS